MILEKNPSLIATVPSELGKTFLRYNAVKVIKTPIKSPSFHLRQYWHPRYHHDPGNTWLRQLVKLLFDRYMNCKAWCWPQGSSSRYSSFSIAGQRPGCEERKSMKVRTFAERYFRLG